MVTVIPIRRCKRCGGLAAQVELAMQDEVFAVINACSECLAETGSRIDSVRPVREAMRSAGVPDDVANETMTSLMKGLDAAHVWPLKCT